MAAGDGAASGWATLQDADGDTVGFAKFTEDAAGGMHVNVHVLGMAEGLHGIHVHTIGSCSSGTAPSPVPGPTTTRAVSSTASTPAICPTSSSTAPGSGHLNTTLAHFTLTDGPAGVFDGDGSALIVHAAQDDYVTNPTGNSGGAHRLRRHPRPLIHRSVIPDRPDRAGPELRNDQENAWRCVGRP